MTYYQGNNLNHFQSRLEAINQALNQQLVSLSVKEQAVKDVEISRDCLAFRNGKIANMTKTLVSSKRRFDWVDSNIKSTDEQLKYLEIIKEVS